VSYAVDVNVLVYASDTTSQFHDPARRFLERCASDPDVLCLTWPTLMAYVRIATNPRIYPHPLAPDQALAAVERLVALPRVRVLSEAEGFLTAYRAATQGMVARGDIVPDAHLATVLRQHGVRTLYTNDRDFLKFRFLDTRSPFEGRA